jgi:hypothetical protein
MSQRILLVEELFPGDPMVPALANYIDQGGNHYGCVRALSLYYWIFRFKAPHPKLKAHERNPVWVWKTLTLCRTTGCPVPFWAVDYLQHAAERGGCKDFHRPTDADEHHAAAFGEGTGAAIPVREGRVHWGERPRLTQQVRRQVKTVMAANQGDNTSEETAMRLLTAVENYLDEWRRLIDDADRKARGECSP